MTFPMGVAGVAALAAGQPPPVGGGGPTYVFAFAHADDALPIFESLANRASPAAAAAVPVDGSSRNETPEPPVPAPAQEGEPEPPPGTPPAPAGQPQGGEAAHRAQEAAQAARQPLPRGEAERRALAHLAAHPDEEMTPGQIAKAIDARGCRDLMARLFARGAVQRTSEKPLRYRAVQQ